MKANWFVRQAGLTSGPMLIRELIEGLAACDDLRGINLRHGKIGSWFPAEELEWRLARPVAGKRWVASSARLMAGVLAGMALMMPFAPSVLSAFSGVSNPALKQRAAIAINLLKARDSLPKKIDANTMRTGIVYDDPVITFSNILLLQSASVPDSVKADISRAVIKNTCASPTARQFMAAGGSIAFGYADVEARPFTSISVADQSCF